jgi:penicillin-binding protein 1B
MGWKTKLLLGIAACVLVFFAICGLVFAYYYHAYEDVVAQRLRQPLFANTAKIYAAPREVRPKQKYSVEQIANDLMFAGYSRVGVSHPSQIGTFAKEESSIHIQPGPQSYHAPDGATVYTSRGVVTAIKADDGQQLSAYELEPELITGLSDKDRGKRRLVTYDELPKYLVPAVTSIEDRRLRRDARGLAIATIQPGQLHADDAGGASFLSFSRETLEAKNYSDRHRLPAGKPLFQKTDLHDLCQ